MLETDLLRHAPEVTPEGQALLAESRERRARAYTGREWRAEAIIAGSFVLAATALAVAAPAERAFDWPVAAMLLLTLTVATQVRFEVASCYTLPTQIVFVPALFLLPPET